MKNYVGLELTITVLETTDIVRTSPGDNIGQVPDSDVW